MDNSSQNTLSVGPKTTEVTDSVETVRKGEASHALEQAFSLFIEESKKLEHQQAHLQSQINLLTNELSDSNQRITALIQAMPAAIILLENQIVKLFNRAAMQFFPFLKTEQLFAIPPHWVASITPGEYSIPSSSANQKIQTAQVVRIQEDFRTIIQIQDITQNILNLQKSQQESRLAAMGKMAASIAHQIRTPLATALLYASHLCDLELDEPTKTEFSEKLRKQLLGLEKLSKEMLQFVGNRPKQIELVALNELLTEADQAIRPLCEEKGVQLHAQLPRHSLKISAEKSALTNAFIAILENALKISQAGQVIEFTLYADHQKCRIIIQDQGPGISQDILGSLFEPFLSGHSTGTGLGLAIAKNAIEAHRGSITAENTSYGARFTISLPCIAEL